MKIVHLAPVLLVSFILAACGGGGGGSDDMTTGPTPPPTTCPAGQTGTPPNCMVPPPPGPTFDGPKTAMAIANYGMLASNGTLTFADDTNEKNQPEIAAETTSTPNIPAVTRAVDGTLSFEDGTQDTDDDPNGNYIPK